MNEWWTTQDAALIGGIGGAIIGVLFGAVGGGLGGPLAAMGKAKRFVVGLFAAGVVLGVALTILGMVAATASQPSHVWIPPLLAGIFLLVVTGPLLLVVCAVYRAHEQRRLAAEEFRRA